MALPSMSEALAFKFIDDLIGENVIKQTRGWLHMLTWAGV